MQSGQISTAMSVYLGARNGIGGLGPIIVAQVWLAAQLLWPTHIAPGCLLWGRPRSESLQRPCAALTELLVFWCHGVQVAGGWDLQHALQLLPLA